MILSDVLNAYKYWTKTPNVLSDSANAVGFAVSNPRSLIPYTPLAYVSPAVKEQEKIFVSNTNGAVSKLPNNIGKALVKSGQVTGSAIKAVGGVVGDIAETVGDVIDPEKSVFSSSLLKYALIAGAGYALYKFGGEFVSQKGAQFARS